MPAPTSIHVSQFSDSSIPFNTARSLCGPAAAIAFARVNGRQPTLREAMELAQEVGWTAENGMPGPESEHDLLTKMGVRSELAPQADERRMADEVKAGRPVAISTGLHYFTASDYDPQTRKFFVSTSGTDVRNGSAWLSLEEMDRLSRERGYGGINGALYMDHPAGQDQQRFQEANRDLPGSPPVAAAKAELTQPTEPDRIDVHRPLAEVGDTGTETPIPTRKPAPTTTNDTSDQVQQYLDAQMTIARALLAPQQTRDYSPIPVLPSPKLSLPALSLPSYG